MRWAIVGIVVIAISFSFYHSYKNKIERLEKRITEYEGKVEELKERIWVKQERIEELKKKDLESKEKMVKYIMFRNSQVYEELAEIIVDELKVLEEVTEIPAIIGLAVMAVESNYTASAKTYKKKRLTGVGIMQINPTVWMLKSNDKNLYKAGIIRRLDDLYKPRENIRAGYYILSIYKSQCERYKQEGRLNGLGYYNLTHCMLNKYFGGSVNIIYYEKVLKAIGEYFSYVKEEL